MDQRSNPRVAADNLSARILDSGADIDRVAKAAGLTTSELNSRLAGAQELTFSELVGASGLLHVRAHSLMEGIR